MLHPDTNTYLHDALKYWPFNETYHLSKFEDFDHTHFDDSHEMGEDSTELYPGSKNSGPIDYGKWRGSGTNDPVFDNNLVTNVTAQLGGTAFLHCRVRNLGERPVSWIRRRDWHILTSGLFTYTNDERFQVVHTEGGDDWNLQIKYVQKRDNGTYECQLLFVWVVMHIPMGSVNTFTVHCTVFALPATTVSTTHRTAYRHPPQNRAGRHTQQYQNVSNTTIYHEK